jgi:hypothetical protein
VTPGVTIPDLRAPALGGVAWIAALAALGLPSWGVGLTVVAFAGLVVVRWRHGHAVGTQLGWLVAAAAVTCSASTSGGPRAITTAARSAPSARSSRPATRSLEPRWTADQLESAITTTGARRRTT